jgi:hypothetical protein
MCGIGFALVVLFVGSAFVSTEFSSQDGKPG